MSCLHSTVRSPSTASARLYQRSLQQAIQPIRPIRPIPARSEDLVLCEGQPDAAAFRNPCGREWLPIFPKIRHAAALFSPFQTTDPATRVEVKERLTWYIV